MISNHLIVAVEKSPQRGSDIPLERSTSTGRTGYFVPAAVFSRLVGELADQLRVLDIDGRRTFGYESVYFDTPTLTTYRAHIQRRRKRFKARTRT